MMPKELSYWIGMCFPSICVNDDVQYMTQAVTYNLGFTTSILECQTSSKKYLKPEQIIVIILFSTIALLAIIGTIIDVVNIKFKFNKEESKNQIVLTKMVKSFSIYTNTKRLLNSSQQKLGCFHGMRFFTACWIIIGHSYFLPEMWYMIKLKNLYAFKEFKTNLALAVIENFSLSVDTFFFMSGVLMTYTTWESLKNDNGHINVVNSLFRKYWRLTPSVAICMGIPFIVPLMGSGPLWNIGMQQGLEACKSRWWTNLLYIQNFWDFDEICLPHSWYLAALMQCHILGITLLIISFRKKLLGITIGIVLILSSITITAVLTEIYNLTLLNILITDNVKVQNPYLDIIYIKPYSHLSTYIIGMAVGYILWKHPKPQIKMIYKIIGWIIAISGNLIVLYAYRKFNTRMTIIIYSAVHRIIWSVGLAWLTYVCVTGHAGFINKFLSWKPFSVLGQLSYWTYLIHFFFLLAKSAYVRNNFYFNHYNMLYTVLGHIMLSFAVAYIFYVTVEMPFCIWDKILFKKKEKTVSQAPS